MGAVRPGRADDLGQLNKLGDRVLGYASSGPYRPKQAYETSVETSVYLAPDTTGRGVGTALYDALFAAIAGEDLHRAYAGITVPNPASVALHERFGFRKVALFTQQGRKFDRYWDVAWFEKLLDRRVIAERTRGSRAW